MWHVPRHNYTYDTTNIYDTEDMYIMICDMCQDITKNINVGIMRRCPYTVHWWGSWMWICPILGVKWSTRCTSNSKMPPKSTTFWWFGRESARVIGVSVLVSCEWALWCVRERASTCARVCACERVDMRVCIRTHARVYLLMYKRFPFCVSLSVCVLYVRVRTHVCKHMDVCASVHV